MTKKPPERIPNFIAGWILRSGLTQVEMAKRAGLSQPTISDLLKGGPYTENNLTRIAIALNLHPAELLMRDPDAGELQSRYWDAIRAMVEVTYVTKRVEQARSPAVKYGQQKGRFRRKGS